MLNSLMSDPGLVLLILFIFMLVCRVPIAISLGLSAAIVSWLFDMGIDMLPYNFFAGVANDNVPVFLQQSSFACGTAL